MKQSEEYAQPLRRGSGDSMYTRKAYANGRPCGVIKDDQPDAREGQAGRRGVTERFAVPQNRVMLVEEGTSVQDERKT